MNPSQINADKELKELISGQVFAAGVEVPVYGAGERPNVTAPDDFIEVTYNGAPRAVSSEMTYVDGGLVVSLFCKLNSDGTVKSSRISKLLEQFEEIVNRHASENYFYSLDLRRLITPTAANTTLGYSVTRFNVEWHTL